MTERKNDLNGKLEKLKTYIKEQGSLAVAFSGGVDSTFLLKTAHDVLGDGCFAITARSASFPRREQEEAAAFCRDENIRQIFFDSERPLLSLQARAVFQNEGDCGRGRSPGRSGRLQHG